MKNLSAPFLDRRSLAIVLLAVAGVTHADIRMESGKFIAADGAASDTLGVSVGISGSTVVVGAFLDDENGTDSGSAYLFDAVTGQQLFRLEAVDGASGDEFGYSAGISGSTVIVGAHLDNDNGTDSGSAYLFNATNGQQLQKLLPTDGSALDDFGFSVGIGGGTAIVGARLDDVNNSNTGAAYLFNTATGAQTFKLFATDRNNNDQFGWAVAVSGTTAIIGAPFDDDLGNESGAAYLFDTTTGMQLHKLLPTDGVATQRFGISVAISGNIAIISANNESDATPSAAYLFDVSTGMQITRLFRNDGEVSNGFGSSVAISGATAIVGARNDNDNGNGSGSAYLFNAVTGEQTFKMLPSDGELFDSFGWSVAIDGVTACVGAIGDDDNGASAGAAYPFFTGAVLCPSDINRDGVIDTADLGILIGDFGTSCP